MRVRARVRARVRVGAYVVQHSDEEVRENIHAKDGVRGAWEESPPAISILYLIPVKERLKFSRGQSNQVEPSRAKASQVKSSPVPCAWREPRYSK